MKTLRNLVYSLFIFITIALLINLNFLENFYWQLTSLFADHGSLVNWLECNSITDCKSIININILML